MKKIRLSLLLFPLLFTLSSCTDYRDNFNDICGIFTNSFLLHRGQEIGKTVHGEYTDVYGSKVGYGDDEPWTIYRIRTLTILYNDTLSKKKIKQHTEEYDILALTKSVRRESNWDDDAFCRVMCFPGGTLTSYVNGHEENYKRDSFIKELRVFISNHDAIYSTIYAAGKEGIGSYQEEILDDSEYNPITLDRISNLKYDKLNSGDLRQVYFSFVKNICVFGRKLMGKNIWILGLLLLGTAIFLLYKPIEVVEKLSSGAWILMIGSIYGHIAIAIEAGLVGLCHFRSMNDTFTEYVSGILAIIFILILLLNLIWIILSLTKQIPFKYIIRFLWGGLLLLLSFCFLAGVFAWFAKLLFWLFIIGFVIGAGKSAIGTAIGSVGSKTTYTTEDGGKITGEKTLLGTEYQDSEGNSYTKQGDYFKKD